MVLAVACAASPPHPSLTSSLDLPFLAARLAATLRLATCPPEVKANVVRVVAALVSWGSEEVMEELRGGDGDLRGAVEQFDAQSDVARKVLQVL